MNCKPLLSLVLAVLFAITCTHAQSGAINDSQWRTNGFVHATLVHGNTLYVGGAFGYFGPDNGSGAPVEKFSGNLVEGFPKVKGSVYKSVPDGNGGWIIGGEFTQVGDSMRSGLAHIKADLSVGAWNPKLDGPVSGIMLHNDTVIVSGTIRKVGGESGYLNIAKVSFSTGQPSKAWKPQLSDPAGKFLLYGDTLFITDGYFYYINGQSSKYLCAVRYSTGAHVPFAFNPDNSVYAVHINKDILYIGGYFSKIAGELRNCLAAYNLKTNKLTPLSMNFSGSKVARCFASSGDTLFVGGKFDYIGSGYYGRSLLAIKMSNSTWLSSWKPENSSDVFDMVMDNSYLYLSNRGAERVRKKDGKTIDWPLRTNQVVYTVSLSGTRLYVGGSFKSIGSYTHYNLAAVDLTTGKIKEDFNPTVGYTVNGLKMVKGRLFLEGDFTYIGDSARARVAALDPETGALLPWKAVTETSGRIWTMTTDGNVIYVGGKFTTINGQTRNNLAALDPETAEVLPLSVDFNHDVHDLVTSGDKLFVCGQFDKVNGQSRGRMAAFNINSGALTAWNPNPDYYLIGKMHLLDSLIYVEGGFKNIGGQSIESRASVDTATGLAASWKPDIGSTTLYNIRDVCRSDNGFFVAGKFWKINGVISPGLAEVDRSGSKTLSVNFYLPEDYPNSITYENGSLFAGTLHSDGYGWKISSVFKYNMPVSAPADRATALTFSNIATRSMKLDWTRGSGANCIVIAREGAPVTELPADRTGYTAKIVFGAGAAIGNGFVVYNGSGSSVQLTGLKPGTQYYFAVIEHNGLGNNTRYQNTDTLAGAAATLNCPVLNDPLVKDTFRCGAGVVSFRLPVSSGGQTYRWYDAATAGNLLASSANFNTPSLNADRSYWVSRYDSASLCEGQRVKVEVKIFTPVKPAISGSGDTLSTSATGKAYQWFMGNNPIDGATASTYVITKSGTYTLKLTDANGCEIYSDPLRLTHSAVGEELSRPDIRVYPNPAGNMLHISAAGTWTVEVFDILSRRVAQTRTTASGTASIDLSAQQPGLYIVRLSGAQGVYEVKVVKE